MHRRNNLKEDEQMDPAFYQATPKNEEQEWISIGTSTSSEESNNNNSSIDDTTAPPCIEQGLVKVSGRNPATIPEEHRDRGSIEFPLELTACSPSSVKNNNNTHNSLVSSIENLKELISELKVEMKARNQVEEMYCIPSIFSANAPLTISGHIELKEVFAYGVQEGYMPMVQHCISLGLSSNSVVNKFTGESALHVASFKGHLPVVDFLLKNSANPDILDTQRNTPLLRAIEGNHIKTAKCLIKHGAGTGILATLKGKQAMALAKDSVNAQELLEILSTSKQTNK